MRNVWFFADFVADDDQAGGDRSVGPLHRRIVLRGRRIGAGEAEGRQRGEVRQDAIAVFCDGIGGRDVGRSAA
jgi:hypothetical protein